MSSSDATIDSETEPAALPPDWAGDGGCVPRLGVTAAAAAAAAARMGCAAADSGAEAGAIACSGGAATDAARLVEAVYAAPIESATTLAESS